MPILTNICSSPRRVQISAASGRRRPLRVALPMIKFRKPTGLKSCPSSTNIKSSFSRRAERDFKRSRTVRSIFSKSSCSIRLRKAFRYFLPVYLVAPLVKSADRLIGKAQKLNPRSDIFLYYICEDKNPVFIRRNIICPSQITRSMDQDLRLSRPGHPEHDTVLVRFHFHCAGLVRCQIAQRQKPCRHNYPLTISPPLIPGSGAPGGILDAPFFFRFLCSFSACSMVFTSPAPCAATEYHPSSHSDRPAGSTK